MGTKPAKSTTAPEAGAGTSQHFNPDQAYDYAAPRKSPPRVSRELAVLTPVHRAVMATLAEEFADELGRCAPSLPELGRRFAMAPLQVGAVLSSMAAYGELRVEDRPGQPMILHLARRFVPQPGDFATLEGD